VSRSVLISTSEDATAELGAALGRSLQAGSVVLLEGELGAGKTAFVRGLAAGLGVDDDQVSSPTFTLVQEYRGRLPLLHADLYRITAAESDDLGLDELGVEGVVAIEWADKLSRRPAGAIEVLIDDLGDDRRRVTITSPDATKGPPGACSTQLSAGFRGYSDR
jgi:tRNA threonylcarbamoyladenosine biosynthesis protein TsaE